MLDPAQNLTLQSASSGPPRPTRILRILSYFCTAPTVDAGDLGRLQLRYVACHFNGIVIGVIFSLYCYWLGQATEMALVFAVGAVAHCFTLLALRPTALLLPLTLIATSIHGLQLLVLTYLLGGIHATPMFVWWATLPILLYLLFPGSVLLLSFALPTVVAGTLIALEHSGVVWPVHFKPDGVDQFALLSTLFCILHIAFLIWVLRQSQSALEDVLRSEAALDSLTGAVNHGSFIRLAKRETRIRQRSGSPCSVAVLDIDHFKQINDQFGHQAGDRALVCLVATCQSALRSTDVIGRLGGDEYAVLLPGAPPQVAVRVMEKLCLDVSSARIEGIPTRGLSISVGVAGWQSGDPEHSAADLINMADKALYEVKRSGRGRVMLAESMIDSEVH